MGWAGIGGRMERRKEGAVTKPVRVGAMCRHSPLAGTVPVRLYHSLMAKHLLLKLMSLWPPLLGAGIWVKRISRDFTEVDVEMTLRVWNQNYVGVHFGGSLYAMTDPFYMLMIMENLGREYIVWDKAATVRFKRPGRGRVRAAFRITREQIDAIRAQADREAKVEPVFQVRVIDAEGTLVAEVEKTLYVRRKDRIPQQGASV